LNNFSIYFKNQQVYSADEGVEYAIITGNRMGITENMKIKNEISKLIPDAEIILFGSQAKGNFDADSDYDILVILNHESDSRDKIRLSSMISRSLASIDIPADVIVQTRADVSNKINMPGSVVKEAMKHGVIL